MAAREENAASANVATLAKAVLRLLRQEPRGLSKRELSDKLGASSPSIQRALSWLRDHHDAPVEFIANEHLWRLHHEGFSLPLSDPEDGDLQAVLMAQALLAPFADRDTQDRVRRLAEEMDANIRQQSEPSSTAIRRPPLTVTVTTQNAVDADVQTELLRAIGKHTVKIEYRSPWHEPPISKTYVVEPWHLRIHDGAYYLRAYSHHHRAPRSFNVGHIRRVVACDDPLPAGASLAADRPDRGWGDDDPAFGIDHDRPGVAQITLEGAIARWVERLVWHPAQRDHWLVADAKLQREVPYRSCRELARRLVSLGDGIVAIEPLQLRQEVEHLASELLRRLDRSTAASH